jgi:drug/metabolite transporter (DMT)-like permease
MFQTLLHGKYSLTVRVLILFFGILCGSTAVIMIKAGDEHPILVAASRLLVAAVILFPFYLRDLRNFEGQYGWKEFSWTIAPAIALAVHFITWVIGARLTLVANASLLSNLTPVAMPFFVWVFFKERVRRQELLGTVFTLAGVFVLTFSRLEFGSSHFLGNMVCFGSMLAFAAYLALGRKNGHRLSLWLYMVPVYTLAGIICLIVASFFINPIKAYTLKNILLMVGLGIIPTVFGHTILNYSLKFFRGQIVSVCNLTQLIFSGLMGYIFFHESPASYFYLAAGLILIGLLLVLFSTRQPQKLEPENP